MYIQISILNWYYCTMIYSLLTINLPEIINRSTRSWIRTSNPKRWKSTRKTIICFPSAFPILLLLKRTSHYKFYFSASPVLARSSLLSFDTRERGNKVNFDVLIELHGLRGRNRRGRVSVINSPEWKAFGIFFTHAWNTYSSRSMRLYPRSRDTQPFEQCRQISCALPHLIFIEQTKGGVGQMFIKQSCKLTCVIKRHSFRLAIFRVIASFCNL